MNDHELNDQNQVEFLRLIIDTFKNFYVTIIMI